MSPVFIALLYAVVMVIVFRVAMRVLVVVGEGERITGLSLDGYWFLGVIGYSAFLAGLKLQGVLSWGKVFLVLFLTCAVLAAVSVVVPVWLEKWLNKE